MLVIFIKVIWIIPYDHVILSAFIQSGMEFPSLCSFDKYLLNAFYVLTSVRGARDTIVNKRQKCLHLQSLYSSGGDKKYILIK